GDVDEGGRVAHLQVSMDALPRLYRLLHDLAREAAGGRYIVLAGGGYNIDVLARAWALQLDELVGAGLDEDLPEQWLRDAEAVAGRPFTPRLMGDTPPEIPAEQRQRAAAQAQAALDPA